MFEKIKRQWKNSNAIIKQLNNDEWKFIYNPLTRGCCDAEKDGLVLWVSNGAWFCEIQRQYPLPIGLIFRHYVWWMAARKKTRQANRKFRKEKEKEKENIINI